MPRLEQLLLVDTRLSTEDLHALAAAVPEAAALRTLDLRQNDVREPDAQQFLDALHDNTSLTSLGITVRGASAAAAGITERLKANATMAPVWYALTWVLLAVHSPHWGRWSGLGR